MKSEIPYFIADIPETAGVSPSFFSGSSSVYFVTDHRTGRFSELAGPFQFRCPFRFSAAGLSAASH